MSSELKQNATTLYDTDYYLWVLETVKNLQTRSIECLDWENLIEDIYPECYQDGREIAALRSKLPIDTFPDKPLASLDQVLDEAWLPKIP